MIIVYSSKSGSSERYARALSERTGLQCFSVDGDYPKDERIVFVGWLRHRTIVGLRGVDTSKLKAVCAVGLVAESSFNRGAIADANEVSVPVYYLRGWIYRSRLNPLDKAMLLPVAVMMKLEGLDDRSAPVFDAIMNGGSFYDESYLDSIELFIRTASR